MVKIKTVTLRLPDELHKKLKLLSVNSEISMQELLTTLIEYAVVIVDENDEKERLGKSFKEGLQKAIENEQEK